MKHTHLLKILPVFITIFFVFGVAQTLAQQQTPLKQIDIGEELFDIAWSPDSQLLAVGSSTGVKILDTDLEQITELQGHTGPVTSVAWNPNGTQLATGGGPEDGSIHIWDHNSVIGTFTFQRTLITDPSTLIFLLAYSPDGTKFASLMMLSPSRTHTEDPIGHVQVWDTTMWDSAFEAPYRFTDPIRALSWKQDNSALVVAGRYGIGIFDAQSGEGLNFIALNFPPTTVLWAAQDKIVYVQNGWFLTDGLTGQEISYWDYPFGAFRMDVNADGSRLIADGDALRVLDLSTGAIVATYNVEPSRALDWNSDGNIVATGSGNGIIQLWDTSNLPDVSGTPTITPLPTLSPSPFPTLTITPTSTVIP